MHLRHALEVTNDFHSRHSPLKILPNFPNFQLSPKNDRVLEALMEIEKIPISSLHVMTILIITVLVLGVLLVLRCFWLQDDEPSSDKREKRCFAKLTNRVSKVRVIRKK